jgi:predicted aspartyl protease
MKRISALLVLCALASGCATPLVLDDDNAAVVTPLVFGRDGHVIVQAMIDGQGPFRFALDTGASISVIFNTTLERAQLEIVAAERVAIQGMIGAGAFPLTAIAELRIENVISDPIDGILGIDFLRQYAVGVSARDQVVRLYPPQLVSQRSYRGWTSIPMRQLQIGTRDAIVYTINLHINETDIPAILDLGAGSNLMNWHTAKAIPVRPDRSERGTELRGVIETLPVTAELQIDRFRIEHVIWRDSTFLVSDFPIFEALGLGESLVAIVGPGLFKQRDFVIDFERQRMLLGTKR